METSEKLTHFQRYQLILLCIATVGGIVTVLVGIGTFFYTRSRDYDTRLKELRSKVWERRVEVYSRTAREAAAAASTWGADREKEPESYKAYKQGALNFRQIYWGEMSMLEDKNVEAAMIIFRTALDSGEAKTPPGQFTRDGIQKLAWEMAHVFRASLRDTWNQDNAFDEFVFVAEPLDEMYKQAKSMGVELKGQSLADFRADLDRRYHKASAK